VAPLRHPEAETPVLFGFYDPLPVGHRCVSLNFQL
jgi:hypothetical protein